MSEKPKRKNESKYPTPTGLKVWASVPLIILTTMLLLGLIVLGIFWLNGASNSQIIDITRTYLAIGNPQVETFIPITQTREAILEITQTAVPKEAQSVAD